MTKGMDTTRLSKVQIIVWPLLAILLSITTSPKKSLIVSFIFFVILWWWFSLVINFARVRFRKKKTERQDDLYYKLSSGVISLCLVVLLALQTLHQLGVMDVVLCGLFGLLGMFYLKRRLREQ